MDLGTVLSPKITRLCATLREFAFHCIVHADMALNRTPLNRGGSVRGSVAPIAGYQILDYSRFQTFGDPYFCSFLLGPKMNLANSNPEHAILHVKYWNFLELPAMTKKRPPVKQSGEWSQRQRLVDEFAALDRAVNDFKPKLFRHEKLRKLILDWYPGVAAEEEFTVPGITNDILVSARDQIRSVTLAGKRKLFKLWGPTAFIAKSNVLLKSLPDPEDEKGLYTVQSLTGPRHLHVIARVAKAADAA